VIKNEFERIWKEDVLALSWYYPGSYVERLKKATEKSVRASGAPA
jgi:hypothetical protein